MNQAATIAPLAVSPEQAGRMTGHTRSAIYEAMSGGALQAFKSGRRRLILVRELETWINRIARENAR